jgi:hypothetical protein
VGKNAVERFREGGLSAKKGTQCLVRCTDLYFPPAGHPLWHPRGEDPLDEEMVLDIMRRGVEHDILVRDDGVLDGRRLLTVIDGARRGRHSQEAERRMSTAGQLPLDGLYVKVELFVGSDAAALLERLRRNADPHKKADRPSVLAQTFEQLQRLGATVEDMLSAAPSGIDARAVDALLRWGNLLPAVAAQFDAGAAPIQLLDAVLDAPRDAQEGRLQELIAAGAKTRQQATRVVRGAGRPAGPPPRLSSKTLARALAVLPEQRGAVLDGVRIGLLLASGDQTGLDQLPPEIRTLLHAALDARRARRVKL